jgi:hypothetical protein
VPPAPPQPGGAETLTADLLENVRWVPYMNWVGTNDELVPLPGPVAQQQRFDDLGLRSSLFVFTGSDHFALAIADEWDAGRDFLGAATVTRDPWRVDYGFFPGADRPELGLVHDHAYWASDLAAREGVAADERASLSARSLAHGLADPTTAAISDGGAPGAAGPPFPFARTATEWTGTPAAPAENALEVTTANLESGTIDGTRAQLDGSERLRVKIETDGATELRLDLALPANAEVVKLQGGTETEADEVTLDPAGADFDLEDPGTFTFVIRPASASGTGAGPGTGAGSGPSAPGSARCKGSAATIVGTAGSDVLRGTPGDDVIAGLGGDDRLRGRGGDDLLCGNAGDDRLGGGRGGDSCYGGAGADRNSASCETARSPRHRAARR